MNRFAVLCIPAVFVAGCVSIFTLFCNLVEYDGAFNAQAAVNFFNTGKLLVDYLPQQYLQTHLPFQLVNGFFLAFTENSLWLMNAANVFFYLLLTTCVLYLSKRLHSILLLLSFTALSLSPGMLEFGFNGYGELPGLVLILLGGTLFTFNRSPVACAISGILLAAGLLTKWVLLLGLAPILVLIIFIKPTRSQLTTLAIAACTSAALFLCVEFIPYQGFSFQYYFNKIVEQTIPTHGSNYEHVVQSTSHVFVRLNDVWREYSSLSIPLIAWLKVLLLPPLLFAAWKVFTQSESSSSEMRAFFLFLSSFLCIYLLWGFFFNARWYGRRLFNSDVLFYLCIGLLPSALAARRRIHILIACLLLLPLITYGAYFYWRMQRCTTCTVPDIKRHLAEQTQTLPAEYDAYSYSILDAPILKRVLQKQTRDLARKSLFFSYAHTGAPPIFFQREKNTTHYNNLRRKKKSLYLNPLFSTQICSTDFTLSADEIIDVRATDKSYVTEINFLADSFEQSTATVSTYRHLSADSMPEVFADEIIAFLNNQEAFDCLSVSFDGAPDHQAQELRLAFTHPGQRMNPKFTTSFTVQAGNNSVIHRMAPDFYGKMFHLYLLREPSLQSAAYTDNFSQIPEPGLRYRYIQLITCPRDNEK